jgi:hypothetical protein
MVLVGVMVCMYGWSETRVVKRSAVKANHYGVTYSLPMTGLEVKAKVVRVVSKVGPYYRYAEKYLGTQEVLKEDKVEYRLEKVWVEEVGIPDPNLTYLIEFKGGTVAPYVYLTEEGLLCAINTEYEGAAAKGEAAVKGEEKEEKGKAEVESLGWESVLTEDMLMASTASKQAELAAKQIYRIRESRLDILTGEADNIPQDGAAMRLMISELESRERVLTQLFVGVKEEETEEHEVMIIPEAGVYEEVVVFRFSGAEGVLEWDDLSGGALKMRLEVLRAPEVVEGREMEKKLKGEKGVVYTIPAKVKVELLLEGRSVYKREVQIAQWGVQESLAPVLFEDKKSPIKVTFYPETGSIKQIIQ